MNEDGEENPCCYFHSKEVVVGVCALCLKERLLRLASKQGQLLRSKDASRSLIGLRRKSLIALPKVFALGSFLHRSEPANQNPDNGIKEASISSLEGNSFITINLEGDGRQPWEGKRMASIEPSWIPRGGEELKGGNRMMIKSMVEQANQRGSMRWRKRIGQIFQLARWNRSRKTGPSHAGIDGKLENIRGRRGCMRNMARTTSTVL